MSVPHNAIMRRIGGLTKKWNKFSADENSRTCIWSVKEEELDMIEAFYEVEKSSEGKTEDVFLKFTTPYANPLEYTKGLIKTLNDTITESKEDLAEAGINLSHWNPQKYDMSKPAAFLKELENFHRFINIKGNVVAYLSPEKNSDVLAWVDWLVKFNQFKAVGVKLMLVQLDEAAVFNQLLTYFPQQCQKLRPDLKMGEAMSELAAQGNPHDPGTRFRQLYVAIMQAAGKSDLPKTEQLAKEGFLLTRKNKMYLMEATLRIVLGGVYISNKKKKQALQSYDEAIRILEQEEVDPQLAGQQMIIAYLSKGMALFTAKNYKLAAGAYEKAAAAAAQVANSLLEMDAWRMAGSAYLKTIHAKAGEACLKKALQAGMKIEEKMRRDSTMPFAGMELYRLENPKGRQQLDVFMTSAIGRDWQQLASVKKQKKAV